MENCQENAAILREGIAATGRFDILSKDTGVPLVAFSLKDSSRFSVFDISENLRRFSWIVPAYTMPADAEHSSSSGRTSAGASPSGLSRTSGRSCTSWTRAPPTP